MCINNAITRQQQQQQNEQLATKIAGSNEEKCTANNIAHQRHRAATTAPTVHSNVQQCTVCDNGM